jgi:hypothetical protein
MGGEKLIPTKWITVVLLMGGSAYGQSFEDQFLNLIEPGAPVVTSGYGGLTIGQNEKGMVTVCRWPEPGSPNHISSDVDVQNGLEWGLIIDGNLRWFSGADWRAEWAGSPQKPNVLQWKYTHERSNIHAVVTTSVHPEISLIVSDITIEGLKPDARIFWKSAFAPVTKRPPEIIKPNVASGFGAYVNANKKFWRHFRPDELNRDAYTRRDDLRTQSNAHSSWETFSEGVWIESWVDDQFETNSIQPEGKLDPIAPLEIEITPTFDGTNHRAVIFTAIANDSAELKTLKETLSAHSFDELTSIENRTFNNHPNIKESEFVNVQFLANFLFRLTSNEDPHIVRAVTPGSLGEKEWPMWGAQMALAMNEAGFRADAQKIVDAYLSKVTTQPDETYGSLPMAHYFDNTLAAPHYAIEFHSPAWVSFALKQIGLSMPKQQQRPYWQERFESVKAMGSFFSDWGAKYPLHPSMYVDEIDMDTEEMTFESNAASWLGLSSVVFITEQIGMPIPIRWRHTLQNLERLLKNNFHTRYDQLMLLSGRFRYSVQELEQVHAHRQNRIFSQNTQNRSHNLLEYTLLAENYRTIRKDDPSRIFQLLGKIEYTTSSKRDAPYYLDGLIAAQVLQIVSILEK